MTKILDNVWVQLSVGLIVGIIGIIISYYVSSLAYFSYGGMQFFDIIISGDKSPITLAFAISFTILMLVFPTIIWVLLDLFGNLKLARLEIRSVSLVIFVGLPLWLYLSLTTISQLHNAYTAYRAVRAGCINPNGVNRNTSGEVTLEFECRNGALNGFRKIYNAQGILTREENFRNGEKEGAEIFYNEDGSIGMCVIYHAGDDLGQVYYQRPEKYYNKGEVGLENQNFLCKRQATASENFTCLNNVFNGEYIRYNSQGNAVVKATLARGVLEGNYEEFSENGKLYLLLTFKNGKLDGRVALYYADGTLEYEGQYANGVQNGLFRQYRYKEKLDWEVVFEQGRLVKVNHPQWANPPFQK